jgi:hypothetical protein
MLTILILTLTILALTICCSVAATTWMARRECPHCRTDQSFREAYIALTQSLLGVSVSSPAPTPTTRNGSTTQSSPSPDEVFDGLSPEIQANLLREYDEHLAKFQTLSGRPARVNPLVEQIVPGQMPNETVYGPT